MSQLMMEEIQSMCNLKDAETSQKRVFPTTESHLVLDWLPSQGLV